MSSRWSETDRVTRGKGEPDDPCTRMLAAIERDLRATAFLTGVERLSPEVRAALASTPREHFVPAHLRHVAYDNTALPIGEGQTISQPFIVALMTELLRPRPHHRVLEVGTGSGYQAAVLAPLVREVRSVEILPSLARSAADRLRDLGLDNVHVRRADGGLGWPEHAPYDGILVAAAAPEVPAPLLEQLAPGGRMVLPLREPPMQNILVLVEKRHDGTVDRRSVLPAVFVPLTGRHGGRRPPKR